MGYKLTVHKNNIPELGSKVHTELGRLVDLTATNIVVGTQIRIVEHDLIDTGAGLNSVQSIVWKERLAALILVGQWYMAIHEFGAPSVNIPARPHLGPSVDSEERDFRRGIAEAIRNGAGP